MDFFIYVANDVIFLSILAIASLMTSASLEAYLALITTRIRSNSSGIILVSDSKPLTFRCLVYSSG